MIAKIEKKLLSIIVAPSHASALDGLLKNLHASISNPANLEIIIQTETANDAIDKVIAVAKTHYNFVIKQTNKQDDPLLACGESYFIQILTEDARYTTPNWDVKLAEYINLYEDNVYRLKISQNKYHNYNNFHDCALVPERFAITTRKWVELAGGIPNHMDYACWQQFINFHLGKSEGSHGIPGVFRSIPVYNITIETIASRPLRFPEYWKMFNPACQREFRKIATRINIHLWAESIGLKNYKIEDKPEIVKFNILDGNTSAWLRDFDYSVSVKFIKLQNLLFLIKTLKSKMLCLFR